MEDERYWVAKQKHTSQALILLPNWEYKHKQIAFTILLATSIGNKMLYSDTVYYLRQGGRQHINGERWKVENKVAINSNFRTGTKITGQLDHSNMHNRLCGKPAASEMFLGTLVLRNWRLWEVWQFSINPHTPRVYGKWKMHKSGNLQKKVRSKTAWAL